LPEEGFTKLESMILLVCFYAAFFASLIGVLISALRGDLISVILYTTILASISAVKHVYSRKLCQTCKVFPCPFNRNEAVKQSK